MSRSTSSSLQTSNVEGSMVEIPKSDSVRKDVSGLKTSNLQIFPSLHPLGNFHRAKNELVTAPSIRAPKPALSDPVKKIKPNETIEKNEKVVQEIIISSPESPLKEEEKIEKVEKSLVVHHSDEFKVPQLPSRLNTVVPKKQIKETKVTSPKKKAEESLVVSDPVMEILNGLKGDKIDSIMKMADLYKTQLAKEQMKRKIAEYMRWLDTVQSQGHLLLDLGVESELVNEAPEEGFLYDSLRQNISEMVSVCQRSQERLAEFLLKH